MKFEPRLYSVSVNCRGVGASLFCWTYRVGAAQQHVGVEFKEFLWPTGREEVRIPSSRQATFREELFATHQAASIFTGSRDEETDYIESLLKETYGIESTISVKSIEPDPLP